MNEMTLTEKYGMSYKEPGPNDIENVLWQYFDAGMLMHELSNRIMNAVRGSKNHREVRKRLEGILATIPGIDVAEATESLMELLDL